MTCINCHRHIADHACYSPDGTIGPFCRRCWNHLLAAVLKAASGKDDTF